MTQISEAIARYHKQLDEASPLRAEWVPQLREQMANARLVVDGRPVTPVLRPHLISRRQYTNLVRAAELLSISIERVRQIALENPVVLSRIHLLPAEKMLAAVDPGYRLSPVAGWLGAHVNNGSLYINAAQADLPRGVIDGDLLGDIFFDAPPVKDIRKRFKLQKTAGSKAFVQSVLKAWKEFGGVSKPSIALLETRESLSTLEGSESFRLAEWLRGQGYAADVVNPEQVEYRGNALVKGEFRIDLLIRGVRAQEFLVRYDLNHPVVRAYRDRRVCMINSFRTELTRKRGLLALLTDERITGRFPAAERKVIQEAVPITRFVAAGRTTWGGETVDLPDFILKNREKLALRPNEDAGETHAIEGWNTPSADWSRALNTALRDQFVVQERRDDPAVSFPIDFYGDIVYRDLAVEVMPATFAGKVQGCTARVSDPKSAFSTVRGTAPVFIVETK